MRNHFWRAMCLHHTNSSQKIQKTTYQFRLAYLIWEQAMPPIPSADFLCAHQGHKTLCCRPPYHQGRALGYSSHLIISKKKHGISKSTITGRKSTAQMTVVADKLLLRSEGCLGRVLGVQQF